MKPKNIMLLGFINRAVEYIDKHMDEEPDARLAELKNIDLASLKDELADNLDSSLGTMQSTMSTLLKAGNEAFDKFIDGNKKGNYADEFNRIFDVELDDSRKNNQEKLASLLAFYNLEDDFEIEEDNEVPDVVEPEKEEVVVKQESVIEEVKEDQDDTAEFDFSEEDHAFMQQIVKNATSEADLRTASLQYSKQTKEDIDSIFSEIVENENNELINELLVKVMPIEEEKVIEEVKPISNDILDDSQNNTPLIKELMEKLDNEKKEKEIEYVGDTTIVKEESINTPFVQGVIDEVIKEAPIIQEPIVVPVVEEVIEDSNKVEEVIEDSNKVEEVIEDSNKIDVEELIEEPIKEEVVKEEIVKEEVVDETPQTYVSTLIDELKQQLEIEEAILKEKEEKNKDIYEQISSLYPFLPKSFVRLVFDLKDEIAKSYPDGVELIVLHRIVFGNVENLRQFVEIGLNHGYQINADEDKMIVDIFKQFENAEGKILANIYEIANQGYLLSGTYDGYNVIVNEG